MAYSKKFRGFAPKTFFSDFFFWLGRRTCSAVQKNGGLELKWRTRKKFSGLRPEIFFLGIFFLARSSQLFGRRGAEKKIEMYFKKCTKNSHYVKTFLVRCRCDILSVSSPNEVKVNALKRKKCKKDIEIHIFILSYEVVDLVPQGKRPSATE